MLSKELAPRSSVAHGVIESALIHTSTCLHYL